MSALYEFLAVLDGMEIVVVAESTPAAKAECDRIGAKYRKRRSDEPVDYVPRPDAGPDGEGE